MEENIKTVQELLQKREARGLRIPIMFRILFTLYGIFSALIAPARSGSIIFILFIAVPFISINAYFLVLLRRTIRVRMIGIIGVIMDSASVLIYPLIVYNMFNLPDQPLAVVSKMPLLTAACIVFIIIESLALRPEYTVAITGSALGMHLYVIFLSLSHPLANWSVDYSSIMSGSEVSLLGMVNSMVFLVIIGSALVWLTRSMRRTVVQAAEIEADKIHMVREQANLLLDSRISVMGEFVAAVSHEMNNPLGVVKANAETGRTAAARIKASIKQQGHGSGETSGNTARILETMEQNSSSTIAAASRMENVLKTLRSFARIDEAEYKLIDIHVSLDSSLALLSQDLIGETEIQKIYGEVLKIPAYAGRINQVMMILLTRALEAVKGTGSVSIKTGRSEKNVIITINDSGPVIPPSELEKIFEVTFLPGKSRIEAGFGMAACRSIVDQHNGRIHARSEQEKGTSFTVELPLGRS